MNKLVYKTSKKYKCPYCDIKAIRGELVDHVDKAHSDLIPENYTSARVVYDFINGKNYGTCMICKKKVFNWNDKINKYYNLCDDPKCRTKVREIALERHMKVYNKPTLLNDPQQQEKMLANRKISGTYTFTDGGKVTYTGKYEKNALEFMDKVLEIPSKDIQAPGPVLEYEFEGQTHKWITDIYYIPANLLIEVKDGGSNPNNRSMQSYRDKQIAKEEMITNLGKFNYIRLTDNNFVQLLNIFTDMKNEALTNENPKATIHINESSRIILIREEKSELDNSFKPKEKIKLSSFKKIRITEEIINRYKKEYPLLKHVRCKDTKEYVCDGYMWMDNDKLVCVVGSCQYTDDNTKWIVSLEITSEYKGHGLSKQILDFAVNTMKCNYLSVNKNNKIAKYIYDKYGFKVYYEDKTMYYMCYKCNNINEEVGGLPPHRPPEAYIIPYGMNNVFSGFAYTDTEMDSIMTTDSELNMIPMIEDVFNSTYEVGPTLIYKESDVSDKIKAIHNAISNGDKATGFVYFVEMILGKKIYKYQEIFLTEYFKYYDKEREKKICKLIENGVISAYENGFNDNNVIKTVNNVMICQSPKGYYAVTPNNFYMASEYFTDMESLLSSDIIKLMNDVYMQNSGGAIHDQ